MEGRGLQDNQTRCSREVTAKPGEVFFMHVDLSASYGVIRWQIGEYVMKLTALLLALPLAFGSGAVMAADTTTTTESTSTNSGMPTSTETKTKVEHQGLFGDKTVEKSKSTTQNPDGSVSTERSKKVTGE